MDLWLIYALGAAVFAALTTILAKLGLKGVDSHLATAIRTMVVLVFTWLMVVIVGSQNTIAYVETRTWVFLILSGLATGGSWLCYFHALKIGDVNKVVPVDKSSTILAMLLAAIFLSEPFGIITAAGMVFIGIGTWLMLEIKKNSDFRQSNKKWLFYAIMAAVFCALTTILGKIGIEGVEANLGVAIRTVAVVPMSWVMVLLTKGHKKISAVSGKNWTFLLLSGLATGGSWLFFYRALQLGNTIHVVPIDKLSIVFTMGFAALLLKERFSKRSIIGLALLTIGTLVPIFI